MPSGKKKKKKHLKKQWKAVHQKKRVFRASEPLLSVFMWGINHSITELNHVNIPQLLLPDDFRSFTKIRIENHLYNKDIFPSKYKFKAYCPLVFHDLRKRFGIDDVTFMHSLTQAEPATTDSPGRSGARFYLSDDHRFVIKTIVSEEVALMHQVLLQYHQYIVESEGETLLPQYLGMYRITVHSTETYLLVMRNIFSSTLTIHKKYDLKGSTVDRAASEREKAKDLPTFKDNDFMNSGEKLQLGEENKKTLMKKIQGDANFLADLKLMDYSLLVGIHDTSRAQQEAIQQRADEEADGDVVSGEETNDDEASGEEVAGGQPEEAGVAAAAAADGAAHVPHEPVVGFVDDRALRPPKPAVVANSELERKALSSDHWPVVNQGVDYYAVLQQTAEPAPVPADSAAAAKGDAQAPCIYFLGVIDVLTHYGARKRAAHAAKTVKHRAANEISTVNPKLYAQRFIDFFEKQVQ